MSIFPSEIASIFEYQDMINFGGFGAVYKVRKISTINIGNKKIYAMKIVVNEQGSNKALKNIESELRILSEVNSPYVIHLDSSFKIEGKVYMIIEYCPNGDLLKAVVDQKQIHQNFDEDEIWKYFIQICFGIESLHTNGFIHRDIKPGNILLDENRNVKLADFGLSRHLAASSVAGSAPFYSPRMCSGEVPTKESDIWALGCVLYYLCNLKDPFKGNQLKIQNEPHMPIKSQYSETLRYFVNWCLKKKREERPTINEILTHDFIFNKAVDLGIRIPTTSVIAPSPIYLLNDERVKTQELENKLSACNQEIKSQKVEIKLLNSEIASLNNTIVTKSSQIGSFLSKASEISNFSEKCQKTLNSNQLIELKNSIRSLIDKTIESRNSMERIEKNDYTKQEILYKTGSVEIFKARLNKSGSEIAVKKLLCLSKSKTDMMRKEGEIMISLDHSNIVKLYSISMERSKNNKHFALLFMEYFPRGDLSTEIRNRAANSNYWREEDLWNCFKSLVKAHSFLQVKNIAHRDIKPENIYVEEDGTLKVAGLGCAWERAELEITMAAEHNIAGTPLYLSPKLREAFIKYQSVMSAKHDPFKSDVYSLGLTFLYMASLKEIKDLADLKTVKYKMPIRISELWYSDTVKNLLSCMLRYDEVQRLSFIELEESFFFQILLKACKLCKNLISEM